LLWYNEVFLLTALCYHLGPVRDSPAFSYVWRIEREAPSEGNRMSQQVATSTTDVVLRLVGESGEGTVSLGDLTVQMFSQMGLDILTFQTFPAEIKGGTVMYQIRARSGRPLSHGDYADVVVALNDEGFGLFGDVLKEDGILLYDSDVFHPEPEPGRADYALPITTLAKAEKEAVRHEIEGEAL